MVPATLDPPPAAKSSVRACVILGLGYYYLTSCVAVLGVILGHEFVKLNRHPLAKSHDALGAFAAWDGGSYVRIATQGYSYNPEAASDIAFFPVYPLLGRAVTELTGVRTEFALLIVSHLFLAGAFVLLALYVRQRIPETSPQPTGYILLSLGLLPTTFYFRIAYTESLFVFLTILAFWAMERKWPMVLIAMVIGLATATRPVGVALIPALVLHVWQERRSTRRFLGKIALLTPLACWGLVAFMAYQYVEFGKPLAFAQAQENFRMRSPVPVTEKLTSLALLQPFWSVFDSSSPCHRKYHEADTSPLFSLYLANPFFLLMTVALIAMGGCKRWLTAKELLLSGFLLLIPYVTRGYDMCMCSQGRFAAAVFPVYLVLGQLLSRLPGPLAAGFLSISGFFLGVYAALFATWYYFF